MRFSKLMFSATLLTLSLSTESRALTGPSNYWECILDRMPTVQDEREVTTTRKQCRWDFPDFYWRRALPKDQGFLFGLFSTKAGECIEKKTKDLTVRSAIDEIKEACSSLYEL